MNTSPQNSSSLKNKPVFGIPNSGCDSPPRLVKATLESIDFSTTSFVLWTGDSPRHDRDNNRRRQRQDTYELNRLAVEIFTNHIPNTIPIIPTIGNWDVFPVSLLACKEKDPQLINLWHVWAPLFPPSDPETVAVSETFLKGGYFAKSVLDGMVTVASLNSLSFFRDNTLVSDCAKFQLKPWGQRAFDENHVGDMQLIWIEALLMEARRVGTKVIIQGHVSPMGNAVKLWKDQCYEWFVYLSGEFSDVILGQYYGHINRDITHVISQPHDLTTTARKPKKPFSNPYTLTSLLPRTIKPLNLKHSRLVTTMYTSSSIVPAYNPGYRVGTLHFSPLAGTPNGWTVSLLRHWTMFLDLDKANRLAQGKEDAKVTYESSCDTMADFGMQDLGVESMEAWVRGMQAAGTKGAVGKEAERMVRVLGRCVETSYSANRGVEAEFGGDRGSGGLIGDAGLMIAGLMGAFVLIVVATRMGWFSRWHCAQKYDRTREVAQEGERMPLMKR
ncbi:Endopolyphosphatase [Podochytrium sp. JEL0797]|nr:Endopolyphosphatase [Podochytrium sp. JEL0797]